MIYIKKTTLNRFFINIFSLSIFTVNLFVVVCASYSYYNDLTKLYRHSVVIHRNTDIFTKNYVIQIRIKKLKYYNHIHNYNTYFLQILCLYNNIKSNIQYKSMILVTVFKFWVKIVNISDKPLFYNPWFFLFKGRWQGTRAKIKYIFLNLMWKSIMSLI